LGCPRCRHPATKLNWKRCMKPLLTVEIFWNTELCSFSWKDTMIRLTPRKIRKTPSSYTTLHWPDQNITSLAAAKDFESQLHKEIPRPTPINCWDQHQTHHNLAVFPTDSGTANINPWFAGRRQPRLDKPAKIPPRAI
jgi:hypothetical protein